MLSKLHPSKKVFVFFLATNTRNYKLSKRWFVWVLVELPENTCHSQLGWILGSSCTYLIKHLNKGSSLCELVCLFPAKNLMVKTLQLPSWEARKKLTLAAYRNACIGHKWNNPLQELNFKCRLVQFERFLTHSFLSNIIALKNWYWIQNAKNEDIRKIDEVYREKKPAIWMLQNTAFLTLLILLATKISLWKGIFIS